jgi:hypothetical protein
MLKNKKPAANGSGLSSIYKKYDFLMKGEAKG